MKQEIDEELRFHIEQRTAENIAAGMSPEEAAREARRRFGNVQSIREECRDVRGAGFGETTLQDIRFGVRMLRKNSGFTAVVVLTLALGIGATTAVYSVVSALLLRPLSYKDSSRLVMVWGVHPQYKVNDVTVRFGEFKEWQERNTVFEQMSAFTLGKFTLTDLQQPEQVEGMRCSASLFPLAGIETVLGRTFTLDEEQSGMPVVLIGHSLWQRRYGKDPAVIGRVIRVNGQSCEIIGVLPPKFQFPRRAELAGHYVASGAEVWLPPDLSPEGTAIRAHFNWFFVLARLKPDVSLNQAQSEMATLSEQMSQGHPEYVSKLGVNVASLQEQTVGKTRGVLLTLQCAMAFILLIACANAANLLLAQGMARQNEIAIRLAIGSTRLRLIRQLLTESVLVAFAAAIPGLLFAWTAVRLLVPFNPGNLPRWDEIQINAEVFVFTLSVTVLTGVLFGLLPAIHTSTPDLANILRRAGKAGGETRARSWTRQALMIVEVSLAFVLLAGTALMVQSFRNVLDEDIGFRKDHLLTFEVPLPESKYREDWKKAAFFHGLLEQIKALPGVESVGATDILPLRGDAAQAVFVEGQPVEPFSNPPYASSRMINDSYLQAMGTTLLRGRHFESFSNGGGEVRATPTEVIINDAFAHAFFPNSDPVGKRLQLGTSSHQRWLTVVGVVKNFKSISLESEPRPEAYVNSIALPTGRSSMTFVIRTRAEPVALAAAVRHQVSEMDSEQPVQNLQTMEQIISHSNATRYFSTVLMTLSAIAGLMLAAVGIYAVISFSVRQRTHELGVRMALGAQRSDIVKLVLKRGVALIAIGVSFGIVGAVAITRVIASQLYAVSATDPLTFALVGIGLAAVALFACWLPARRITRIEPMTALRYE